MKFPNLFSNFDSKFPQNNKQPKSKKSFQNIEKYSLRIEEAKDFRDVWEIVKETVNFCLGKKRQGMLLFLDDLPLHLGAYHQLGTNNIVLNRILVNIVEAVTKSKTTVNAFIYSILTHEYLHALGHVSETEVRSLVRDISKKCFGEDHIISTLAQKTPWILLKGLPLNGIKVPKHDMELVKDLEKQNHRYIV
jgi:hypothetical protein